MNGHGPKELQVPDKCEGQQQSAAIYHVTWWAGDDISKDMGTLPLRPSPGSAHMFSLKISSVFLTFLCELNVLHPDVQINR